MEELDLLLNDNPVCPSCGKEMMDAWELDLTDGDRAEVECGSCNMPMMVECVVTVRYTTSKPNAKVRVSECSERNERMENTLHCLVVCHFFRDGWGRAHNNRKPPYLQTTEEMIHRRWRTANNRVGQAMAKLDAHNALPQRTAAPAGTLEANVVPDSELQEAPKKS